MAARRNDTRRPTSTPDWQPNGPGASTVQGRTPTTTDSHVRRRPRVKAS